MGKLVYEPQIEITQEKRMDDLDELAGQCQKILNTEYSDKLDISWAEQVVVLVQRL